MRAARRWRQRRATAALLVVVLAALPVAAGAQDEPPLPAFFWPYGRVERFGANIQPAEQTIVALIDGRACGEDRTAIATADPDTPPEDVGRTVYVVTVLAEGEGPGQRPGCGQPGDTVRFYFPESGYLAAQAATFAVGPARVDLALGTELDFRLRLPMAAADGAP